MRSLLLFLAALATIVPARAAYLFADPGGDFPIPGFANQSGAKKEYSEWDVFYAPHTAANYPDVYAPHGGAQVNGAWRPVPRSAAGFPANDAVYAPKDPLAFWDAKNATLTQTGGASAFIIGADSTGNIYSFSAPTSFSLKDSTADATSPYKLGTVMFQFQTDGTVVDFSSIKLRFKDGANATHELAATDYLREFLGGASAVPEAANAFTNRVALQWNLTGLNVDTYEIVFASEGPSMSFQRAVLDTSDTAGAGVPASRTWTAATGDWSAAGNWAQGSSSVANGNVRFANASASAVSLDGDRTIGEMIFQSPANVVINRPGAQTFLSNTGIGTTAAATGSYTINAPWQLGATNIFELAAGAVRLNGVVSGNYGLLKKGAGTLVLGGNNTFAGGITLQGGTLRLAGANTYSGGTAILQGRLEIAADSPSGSAGALGVGPNAVTLGSDSTLFATTGGAASIWIDGNRTVAQRIELAAGGFEKQLGALGATAGATFSGAVDFGTGTKTAGNVRLSTQSPTDRLAFTGTMTGGSASDALKVDGPGRITLGGGTEKSFAHATTVAAGTLEISAGTAFTGNGNWTVNTGARLRVDGSFAGSGALALAGGTLTGAGVVSKSLNLAAGRVAPGVNVGSLKLVGAQTWSGGGGYEWQVADSGADVLEMTGALDVAATAGSRFTIYVSSVTMDGLGASLADFDAATADQWLLATASGGITGFSAGDFVIDASAFRNAPNGKFSVSRDGNSLFLNFAPVPEPAPCALLLLAAGWIFLRRRPAILR